MVTGIEIAGLVLAVVPLIISALEAHSERAIVPWRTNFLLKKLLRRLEVEHVSYKSNLEILVRAATRDPYFQVLPQDLYTLEWGKQLEGIIEQYLDTRYQAFRAIMGDYERCMQQIARKLRHVNLPKGVRHSIIPTDFYFDFVEV
jgi:hypothetical protein